MRFNKFWWAAFVGLGLVLALFAFEQTRTQSWPAEPKPAPMDPFDEPPSGVVSRPAPRVFRSVSDKEWNAMSPDERTEILMDRFDQAVERLEQDGDDVGALQEARTVLSLLRSELNIDDAGRRRHSNLEKRLERLTER